jgi:hypothetical protein
MRHALLDFGSAASRLDEPGFAGVCPMASPDPTTTKIRANRVTRCGTLSVIPSGTASRLDESGFAGVCPMACLNTVLRSFRQMGRGAEPRRFVRCSRCRFVRKGLEGREAVASNIKKHALHVFLYLT